MAIETTPGLEPTTAMMRTLPRAEYLSDGLSKITIFVVHHLPEYLPDISEARVRG